MGINSRDFKKFTSHEGRKVHIGKNDVFGAEANDVESIVEDTEPGLAFTLPELAARDDERLAAFMDNADNLTVNILRSWERERIVRFAKHLLGSEYDSEVHAQGFAAGVEAAAGIWDKKAESVACFGLADFESIENAKEIRTLLPPSYKSPDKIQEEARRYEDISVRIKD